MISLICVSSQSWGLPWCITKKDQINGCYNIIDFEDGSKSEGIWKNYSLVEGIKTNKDGKMKIGVWKDGDFLYKKKFKKRKRKIESKLPDCGMGNKDNCYAIFHYVLNPKIYEGEWKDNEWHGKGILTHKPEHRLPGNIYIGDWKKHKRDGFGTQTYGYKSIWAGHKYKGQWKNDKFHGQGTYFHENNKIILVGEWKKGNFIQKNEKRYSELNKSNKSSKELNALKLKAEKEKQKRKELERKLAQIEKEQKNKPKTELRSEFPSQPINVNFKSINKIPDDIAVIIGNANYKKQGKDIPNVNPAYADAEGIKQYFMQALGIKEGNIIYLKDATGSQLLTVFGNQNTHKGKLYNWVKPNISNVYVYYAGHGVPGGKKGNAYLVPTDADSQSIGLSGYPLETLYSNLGKLSAKSITVILEACFSGASQAGNLFSKSSPIVIRAKKTMIPKNVKVITAGAVDQMASWEQDNSHGLFTKYFLKAMSGEGDKNNDGKVSDTELKDYLGETMTYYARRYYGRDQNVQILQGN